MTSEHWQKIKELFDAASNLGGKKRAAFLDNACGSDIELRREVEDFFTSLESIKDFLEKPAVNEVADLITDQKKKEKKKGQLINGEQIAHYKILRQIGAGGMGEVYLVKDIRLNRLAALKVLPENLAADKTLLERFKQEAHAASVLNHPNIITIYDIGKASEIYFITTEFVEGETLRGKIARAELNVEESLNIAVQIASALATAHNAGVIHRDVKPENVMLRPDGIVKLLDFGLAKLTESSTAEHFFDVSAKVLTTPGIILGTVSYMSPEQARGLITDCRTDVWSLGVVLYEMLAGRVPFAGATLNHTIVEIIEKTPASLSEITGKLPPLVGQIIAKSLAKEPSERYQTATELLIDLNNVRRSLEIDSAEYELPQNKKTLKSRKTAQGKANFPGTPPNNLSRQITKLIGREKEIQNIKNLLRQDDIFLLTLTGTGGTGKTSLAKTVAQDLLNDFPDGVFFIDLSAIHDSALVSNAIAQTLGIREGGGKTIPEIVQNYLKERAILLVADNFEQVGDAAEDIAVLLDGASRLKILVTSRVTLKLKSEHEFAVAPLDVPDERQNITAIELQNNSAVALFIERAKKFKPDFELTGENAAVLAEICRRLDGLPLAIELVSARVKLMSPHSILARLDRQLQILTGGARDLPARQQTMRDTIAWSYDLLDEPEKRLFERLAVFTGGFTLEAAEAVCEWQKEEKQFQYIETGVAAKSFLTGKKQLTSLHKFPNHLDVLDTIASLINKSLLTTKEQANGEMRFRMLEAVSEFARERLQMSGNEEICRQKHMEYFLAFGEKAEPELLGANQAEWTNLLEAEHDNLRDALNRLTHQAAEKSLRLAAAIRNFWVYRGHLTEGRSRMEEVLARNPNAAPDLRGKILNAIGGIARMQGDYQSARNFYEQALIAAISSTDKRHLAQAHRGLGTVAYLQNDYKTARLFLEQGLAISRQLNDTILIAISLNALGELARAQNDFVAARPLYEETLALSRQFGNKEGILNNLNNLGAVLLRKGNIEGAKEHYTEAIVMAQEMGHKAGISYSLDGFAAIAAHVEDIERAVKLAGAAQTLRQAIGCEIEPTDRIFREVYLSGLCAVTGEKDFAELYMQGAKLKLAEAVRLAFEISAA